MKTYSKIFLGVGLLFFVLFAVTTDSKNNVAAETSDREVKEPVTLRQSQVPLTISGLVTPSESAVLAAKTAGELEAVLVHEGMPVKKGDALARISVPVAVAGYTEAEARSELNNLQQTQAVLQSNYEVAKAEANQNTARRIAELRNFSSEDSVQMAAQNLKIALEAHLAQSALVLDFIDNNQGYFDASAEELYEEVTRSLYGTLPSQFGAEGGATSRSADDAAAVRHLIAQAEQEESVDIPTISRAATMLEIQSQTLTFLLTEAEERVFGERDGGVPAEVYETFTGVRGGYFETLAVFSSQQSQFVDTVRVLEEQAEDTARAVVVTEADLAQAQSYQEMAEKINSAVAEVAAASQRVAAAKVELGVVRAPFDGVVVKVLTDVGAYMTPGTPIVELSGNDVKEIEITLASPVASFVEPGQALVLHNETIGTVQYVGAVASDGTRTAVASVLSQSFTVGSSMTAEIMVQLNGDVYVVPRTHVHFDALGAYILYEDQTQSRAGIVYDNGDVLYIAPAQVDIEQDLLPALRIEI